MNSIRLKFTIRSLLLAVFFLAYILAGYCRGNDLLGRGFGFKYAIVASLLTVLILRALSQTPLPKLRLVLLLLFSIPVSLAFAFPTYVNPDFQHFVSKARIDRDARRELATLFASDPAYLDLGVSTTHSKIVSVEIYGSVQTKSDLDRLRSQVLSDCQFVESCSFHWRVHVRKKSRTYVGLKDEVVDTASG